MSFLIWKKVAFSLAVIAGVLPSLSFSELSGTLESPVNDSKRKRCTDHTEEAGSTNDTDDHYTPHVHAS